MIIILMRGARNILVAEVKDDFENSDTIYWGEHKDMRLSVFDYSHTTKRGRVFRERKFNGSSAMIYGPPCA